MKVKICGITSSEDASMCEDLGADALGFVHVPGRSRSLSLDKIADVCCSIGPLTSTFLICAPASVEEARDSLERSGADGLQLYTLGPEEIGQLRKEGAMVLRVVPPDRTEAIRYAKAASAVVFENGRPGTGSSYDYSKLPMDACPRTIIAGGLNMERLASAKRMNPYGLDVSSGVERVPGKKDRTLVEEFIRRAKE